MMTSTDGVSFEVVHDGAPAETLVVGLTRYGLAGLTAADYLGTQLAAEQTGHVTAAGLPSITPFENGVPRHHTRLLTGEAVSVLVGEQFLPTAVSGSFARTLLDWATDNGVEEVVSLTGVPLPHGPAEHRTFHVATDDFRAARLADADVPGMGSGFLDGADAALVESGIDSDLGVGVLVTPVHAQVPDVEAALRLLETTVDLYDLTVETEPLEAFAAEVGGYYSELQARMEDAAEDGQPEDRMYM